MSKLNKAVLKKRNIRGFTFLEVIVVVAILILLATIVIVNYSGRVKQANYDAAKLQINEISKALEIYKIDNGFYPTTEQGLKALVEKPEVEPIPKKWRESYMDSVPKDPWGNEYVYIYPGSHEKNFDLFSYGEDGVESEDDVVNWNKEEDETE